MIVPESELPRNRAGRFYHIDCGPGDIAGYVLTCADPARAMKVAAHFDTVEVQRGKREFVTFTGTYRGVRASVMGTGIGPGPTAIAMVEACQCVSDVTFIRLGTCGAIQENIALGDLVITERAIRDETTTNYYAAPEVEADAHRDVLEALTEAARRLDHPFHRGMTCTTSDFYAGQARCVPGFPCLDRDKIDRLRAGGVLNFDMEMSVYLTLARVSEFNIRAGGLCGVVANRISGEFASPEMLESFELRCIETGLLALELLQGTSRT
ncbi:MAG: nucleoside phosphorylase [Desulfomonile tiedjei]|nr:nucleoside phosphorylase [Desulfomonile tiedjei]